MNDKTNTKFNFSEPILNTTKLGLSRFSVYNSVFNVNKRNNQFLYGSEISTTTPRAYELAVIVDIIKARNK